MFADTASRELLSFSDRTTVRDFYDEYFAQTKHQHAAEATRKNHRTAIAHLDRHLQRPATLVDLATAVLEAAVAAAIQRGSKGNAETIRLALARIGNAAAELKLIEAPHTTPVQTRRERKQNAAPPLPWSLVELNQLLGAARTMPGFIAHVPANRFWRALMFEILDTRTGLAEVLSADRDAYDRRRGTLGLGPLVYSLHPRTVAAIDACQPAGDYCPHELLESLYAGERRAQCELCGLEFRWRDGMWDVTTPDGKLLEWPWDGGKPPFYMAYHHMRTLLFRAGLPAVTVNLFDRLRITGEHVPDVLDRVNPDLPFKPREGKPPAPSRPIGRRRAAAAAARPAKVKPGPKPRTPDNDPSNGLRRFLEDYYIKLRLAGKSPATKSKMRGTVRRLYEFAGPVVVEQLDDDLVERFMADRIAAGRTPETVNGYRRELLALWRYAWKKRKTETQPRDVPPITLMKRVPKAWSLEELGRILHACARQPGDVDGVPARIYWPCLVLVLYESGLRVRALAQLTPQNVNFDTGQLFVPAECQKHKSDQWLAIHPDTLALLRQFPDDRQALFPKLSACHWRCQAYRPILQAAGLPSTKKDLFHKLRRTSGTYVESVLDEAAAVQHLGHSDAFLYRQFYRDPSKLRCIRAADVLPRPEWRPSA